MYYCEECRMLCEDKVCSQCGRILRMPQDDDPCFLIERKEIWAGVLKEVLENHNIPHFEVTSMGAGLALKVGPMFETHQFYVPYVYYQQAQECVKHLFKNEEE